MSETSSGSGTERPKRSLRVVIGQAIDLLVSALAILVTGDAVLKFLKRRRKSIA